MAATVPFSKLYEVCRACPRGLIDPAISGGPLFHLGFHRGPQTGAWFFSQTPVQPGSLSLEREPVFMLSGMAKHTSIPVGKEGSAVLVA